MHITLHPQFLFISILLVIIFVTNSTRGYSHCLEEQRTLLLDLSKELIFNSSYSTKLVKWSPTDDCCSWRGVECDGTGNVVGLHLDDEAISGELERSSSLFSLRHLKKLNLAFNNFKKTRIPRGVHNLTCLTHLNLSGCGFRGQVPAEVSILNRLVSLDLSWNWDVRSLNERPSFTMLLRNLTRLRELYLDGIRLSSQWCHILSSYVPGLRILSLQSCGLSGPLSPSLLQLRYLSVLHLDRNNLSTAFPNFFANFSSLSMLSLSACSLQGSLPVTIFQVPTLQNLDLSGNKLLTEFRLLNSTSSSGSLPYSFLNVSMLSHIDLYDCGFTGQIPSMLANLKELVHLDLSSNFLTGSIPLFHKCKKLARVNLRSNNLTGSLSSLHFGGLSDLVYIDLGENSLTGSIPLSLFCLSSLQELWLPNNQFSGQVDEFPSVNFSNMHALSLRNNRLEGPIPDSFFKLESLISLSLSYNFFNGTFQLEKIKRLHNLTHFDLSHNSLSVVASSTNPSLSTFPRLESLSLASCNMYTFPDPLNRSSLRFLDLSNNRITGEIPNWIWEKLVRLNLSHNHLVDLQKPYRFPSSLDVLDLHSNQLRGELPLPQPIISFIDYSNNNFNNSIHSILDYLFSLVFLSLANNSLSGSIPPTICNVGVNFQLLDLSLNRLSGKLPPCIFENTIYGLTMLNLKGNNISGHIPRKVPEYCQLKTLDLSDNSLEGKIPRSLSNCFMLEVLNVGNNHIVDHFPCMLPTSLRVLVLRSNRFHGEMTCHRHWPNLQIIDISSNNFGGSFHPGSFSSWRGMMLDNDAYSRHNNLGFNILFPSNLYYHDEVTLTIKGSKLKLVNIWEDFVSIDFSCNNFKGEIPDSVGDLSSLYLLNLSHNKLSGTIPRSLGNLSRLGSLDLSANQLGGTIPMEIGRLTFLSVLNLSYNKLFGMIPNGPQIQTFSADSFRGNAGLCGLPVNISCINSNESDVSLSLSVGRMEIEWEYILAALGYVVGLGSVIWVLLCCQNLRKIYFEKVDEVLEQKFEGQDTKRRRRRRVVKNKDRR